ncbi:hypothetical protein LCGC14_3091140, partial [marine sediment metagenome]
EAEGASAPEAEVKTPAEASKVSPEGEKVEEKPIHTQAQTEFLVHVAKSEAGRLQKIAEDERDEFKTKAEKADGMIEDIQKERDTIKAEIEELTSDDPKKFDLVTRENQLREAQRTLKTATEELATQQKDNETIVTSAKETLLEIAIWEVATEYKSGDPVKLKNLCATLGVTDEAKLREVADKLWEKAEAKAPAKKAEGEGGEKEVKEKLNLDSGDTHGGGEATEQDVLDNLYPTMAKKK